MSLVKVCRGYSSVHFIDIRMQWDRTLIDFIILTKKIQGRMHTFQNRTQNIRGREGGLTRLRKAALHKPLYKVSFHWELASD